MSMALRKNQLNPLLWYGMSGTHTHSVINNKDYYYNISNKMERSDWRLPFFKKHVLFGLGHNSEEFLA